MKVNWFKVNLRGTGSVTVSKDATGILLTGVDNDTKIANLTKEMQVKGSNWRKLAELLYKLLQLKI